MKRRCPARYWFTTAYNVIGMALAAIGGFRRSPPRWPNLCTTWP
jgi:hypothetical protein